ncbi:MAG: D-3-phosphoglycerate dehydrogenase [Verrucomicrobia bacterium ADurb.Bin474]|nr:MAG: D-3-phosphoglycerate dehydrogenase [Verrucomicrobia bacterium ADurb.Bin474]
MGRIGKEVAVRARAFGMTVLGYDLYWDAAFAEGHQVERVESLEALWPRADLISLHVNLSADTRDLVCASSIAKMKKGVVIINCARGEIVKTADVVAGLESGQIGGYGTDVLDVEPPEANHPLLRHPRCIVTPHVGSRTFESVLRQATMCVENLRLAMAGNKPLAQVNQVPIPPAD